MATALAFLDSLPSVKRYSFRLAFSNARKDRAPAPEAYQIYCGSSLVMPGRTFGRDDAEAICAALEQAAQSGFDEAVEG